MDDRLIAPMMSVYILSFIWWKLRERLALSASVERMVTRMANSDTNLSQLSELSVSRVSERCVLENKLYVLFVRRKRAAYIEH